jgi:hypothetical protein
MANRLTDSVSGRETAQLPGSVDEPKVDAKFDKGVLELDACLGRRSRGSLCA